MKFGICNEIFAGWKLEDAMAYAKNAGYHAIEIAPFTIAPYVTEVSQEKRMEIRFAAETLGLNISGIHWVLAHTEGMHLTHPDEEVRVRTAKYLVDLVDFCADIGGEFMVVGSPKQRDVIPGVMKEGAWQFARAVFRDAVIRAGERNVTICIEPLAPEETNFINTVQEAIRFTQQFNSPYFKIVLDVKAMSSERFSITDLIKDAWPNFAYFHANDTNLKGPGFGKVDFKPIATALKKVGYNGYVSVEVFNFEEGPEVIATKSLETLKKAFGI
ncbi:MAG: sugar phosphate isomerase/epimerase [Verrucomicrobia bacterium]|nr:sugar phosphate isomerase/epimerase [Verrucomicrobiota bacterium]